MSHQASLIRPDNGRQSARSESERSVVGSAAGVAHDIAELLELQAKLLVTDSKTMARRSALPFVLMIAGYAVLLGCTPVALESLAELFVDQLDWSRPLSFLAAAGCGAIFAALLVSAGWWRFRHVFDALKNSREELNRNISWIKQSLKTGGAASSAHRTVERSNIA